MPTAPPESGRATVKPWSGPWIDGIFRKSMGAIVTPTPFHVFRYGCAIGAFLVTILVAYLDPFTSMKFSLCWLTVAVIAWRFGIGPGLLVLALASLALTFFFLPPLYTLHVGNRDDFFRLMIFMVGAAATAFALNWTALKDPRILENQSLRAALANASTDCAWIKASLQEMEQRFEALADSLADQAVFLLDANGNVWSWRESAARLTGYSARQIIGQPWARLCVGDQTDASGQAERDLQTTVASGRLEKETWCQRPDGTRFRARVVLTSLKKASEYSALESSWHLNGTSANRVGGYLVVLRS